MHSTCDLLSIKGQRGYKQSGAVCANVHHKYIWCTHTKTVGRLKNIEIVSSWPAVRVLLRTNVNIYERRACNARHLLRDMSVDNFISTFAFILLYGWRAAHNADASSSSLNTLWVSVSVCCTTCSAHQPRNDKENNCLKFAYWHIWAERDGAHLTCAARV